jgi:uncharacterized protein YcfJ
MRGDIMEIQETVRGPPSPTHVVNVSFRRGRAGTYAFTISDAASGAVIGRLLRRCGPDGKAPRVELADVVGAIEGIYSDGCLQIDLRCRNGLRPSLVRYDRPARAARIS